MNLTDVPVLELVTHSLDTGAVLEVELPGTVEVEDGGEDDRVTVKKELVVDERIGIAEVDDGLVTGGAGQLTKSRGGN